MKHTTVPSPGTIFVRPSVRQWLCNEWFLLLLDIAGYLFILLSGYSNWLLLLPLLISLHLWYQLLYLRNMKFTFTQELLIHEYGVFSKRFEYVELYRVFDFHETISFVQNLLGIKTVIIYSGDRTSPRLAMSGVEQGYSLVPTIRHRVEYNKRRKGIYEFTNR